MSDPNWMIGIGAPPPLDLAALAYEPPPEVTHRFEVTLNDRHLRALARWRRSWLSVRERGPDHWR